MPYENGVLVHEDPLTIGAFPLHGCLVASGADRRKDEDHRVGTGRVPVEVLIVIAGKRDVGRRCNLARFLQDRADKDLRGARLDAGGKYDTGEMYNDAAV